jgi:hypothetical protein
MRGLVDTLAIAPRPDRGETRLAVSALGVCSARVQVPSRLKACSSHGVLPAFSAGVVLKASNHWTDFSSRGWRFVHTRRYPGEPRQRCSCWPFLLLQANITSSCRSRSPLGGHRKRWRPLSTRHVQTCPLSPWEATLGPDRLVLNLYACPWSSTLMRRASCQEPQRGVVHSACQAQATKSYRCLTGPSRD